MLVVYLASYKQKDLLNGQTDIDIKKVLSENVQFENFVKKDMQFYKHATELYIQRDIIEEKNPEFLELLNEMQLIYNVRITVQSEGLLESDPEFAKDLVRMGIYNIVYATEINEIQEQIRTCLAEGYDEEYWYNIFPELREKIIEEIKESGVEIDYSAADNVIIAFAGSQIRVGTTKLAVNLAEYLTSQGATVAYCEPKAKFINTMVDTYVCDISNPKFARYKNIDFSNVLPVAEERNYNFIIADLGSYSAKTFWNKADIKVLCGCTDFTEFPATEKSVQELKPDVLICNFTAPESRNSIEEKLSADGIKISYAEYDSTPLFSETKSAVNNPMYESVLSVYTEQETQRKIAELSGDIQQPDEDIAEV